MALPNSSRRLIALVTAVFLLLCQTAFAAQACAHGFAAVAGAAGEPCHGASDEPVPSAGSSCEVSSAVAEPVKLPVLDAGDLRFVGLVVYPAEATALALHDARALHPPCRAPPLTVLHCRFLN